MPYIQPLSDSYHVCAQLSPEDLPGIASAGFTTLVCMRPDGEAPGQPSARQVAEAAETLGLEFHLIPARSGAVTAEHAQRLRAVLEQSGGPILAYCASGNRCTIAYRMAIGQAG